MTKEHIEKVIRNNRAGYAAHQLWKESETEQKQLREQLAAEREKVQELEAWKQSAIAVMPDYQAIGKELGLRLGQSVPDRILPSITKLREQLHQLREQLAAAHEYAKLLEQGRRDAVAAARQPLMDALTLIANAEPYDSAVSPRLVAQATLAKVKERKQ